MMGYKDRKSLGYIELDSGKKEIMPMNDFFLSYLFNKKENWEMLRKIHNILVQSCKDTHKDKVSNLELITDDIDVESQYEYILDEKHSKVQDVLIKEEDKNLTYIEFQNRSRTEPPLKRRGVEYFSLGIGRTRGEQLANQMWILGEHSEELLGEEVYENYTLLGQLTGRQYPNKSSILYVSLVKLSKEDSRGGELARFLLGIDLFPKDEDIINISKGFNRGFDVLREDKEARNKMSNLEYIRSEARYEALEEGREEGREEGIIKTIQDFLAVGISIEKVAEATKLSIDRIRELVPEKL